MKHPTIVATLTVILFLFGCCGQHHLVSLNGANAVTFEKNGMKHNRDSCGHVTVDRDGSTYVVTIYDEREPLSAGLDHMVSIRNGVEVDTGVTDVFVTAITYKPNACTVPADK